MTVPIWKNKTTFNKYKLKLKDRQIASVEHDGRIVKSFIEPDNHSKLPKLYVVKEGSSVVYVGQTTQNMRTRLWQGLKAQGSHGYSGYHWKDLPEVDILVRCFPDLNPQKSKYLETLEGELVFLVRKHTGKWPRYQTEIHFHNAEEDEVKLAEAIFRELIESKESWHK